MFYLYPPAPSPTPGLSGSSLLFLVPRRHCFDKRPLGSSHMGWGPLFKMDATTWPHMAKDLFCLSFCFQPTMEQRSQDQLTNRYKAKRQRDSDSGASHRKRWRQGRSMPPDGKAPKWMEPSVQSLSHAWVECSIGWHSCGCWTRWMLSGQSQPLSLIMCASSMMYLPSLYF